MVGTLRSVQQQPMLMMMMQPQQVVIGPLERRERAVMLECIDELETVG